MNPSAVRVLVADDDRRAVESLTEILRREGYDARGVYSGAEALRQTREFRPDVVVLDIRMPRLTGYEVARMLRDEYGEKGPMLIAVTGWQERTDRLLSKLVGFDHHFSKPYDARAVLAAISDATGRAAPRSAPGRAA